MSKEELRAQMVNGAAALRVMAQILTENLNTIASGMEKSLTGGLDGTKAEDDRVAYAADAVGFLSHKLQSACMALLGSYGDKYLGSEEEARAFAEVLDNNLETLKTRLTSVANNGLQ